jgi:hypothetical protein
MTYGDFDWEAIREAESILANVIYFLYVATSAILLLNLVQEKKDKICESLIFSSLSSPFSADCNAQSILCKFNSLKKKIIIMGLFLIVAFF